MDDMPRAITLHSCTSWCSRAAVDWYTGKESLDQNSCTAGRWLHYAYRHERSIAKQYYHFISLIGTFCISLTTVQRTHVLKVDCLVVYGLNVNDSSGFDIHGSFMVPSWFLHGSFMVPSWFRAS